MNAENPEVKPEEQGAAAVKETPTAAPQNIEGFENEIREFNETFADFNDSIEYEVKLYRVTGPRRIKKYLKKFINEKPDEDRIGDEFGGGKFAVMGVHPVTGKLHCKYFDIDEIFTQKLEAKNAAPGANMEMTSQIVNPLSHLKETIELVKSLTANQNPLNVMEGMTDMFTSGMKKIQNAVIDKNIEQMRTEPVENDKSEIAGLIELITNFGNRFLEARGQQANLYKQIIQADPKFQAAQEDRDLIADIYDTCCDDPNVGKEKIDAIMKKLGMEVPADPVESVQTATNVGDLFTDPVRQSVNE